MVYCYPIQPFLQPPWRSHGTAPSPPWSGSRPAGPASKNGGWISKNIMKHHENCVDWNQIKYVGFPNIVCLSSFQDSSQRSFQLLSQFVQWRYDKSYNPINLGTIIPRSFQAPWSQLEETPSKGFVCKSFQDLGLKPLRHSGPGYPCWIQFTLKSNSPCWPPAVADLVSHHYSYSPARPWIPKYGSDSAGPFL